MWHQSERLSEKTINGQPRRGKTREGPRTWPGPGPSWRGVCSQTEQVHWPDSVQSRGVFVCMPWDHHLQRPSACHACTHVLSPSTLQSTSYTSVASVLGEMPAWLQTCSLHLLCTSHQSSRSGRMLVYVLQRHLPQTKWWSLRSWQSAPWAGCANLVA